MEHGPRRMIVFMGAPTTADLMKTWTNDPPPPPPSVLPILRPFEIDPHQRTDGVTWRRLTDPVDSLSQELAETTVDPRTAEETTSAAETTADDNLLERSFRVFDHDEDDMDPAEISQIVSQASTPFLAGYDFDMNEITELEDLPEAKNVNATNHKSYSFVVAVTEISSLEKVTTKYGKSISLVKLLVADQTRSQLEIACWEHMASVAQTLRVHDIVHFRGIISP